jgi:serine/threonine protein kinase
LYTDVTNLFTAEDFEEKRNLTPAKLTMEEDGMTSPPILESVLSTSRVDFDLRYQKLDEIGRGGFSVVYKCRDKETGTIYAVKVRNFN